MQVLSGEIASTEILKNKTDDGKMEIQNLFRDNKSNLDDGKRSTHIPGISQILPSLYLCGAGLITRELLDSHGIKFVVSACPELPDTPLSPEKQLYLRINIQDRGDADLKFYFNEVSDLIEEVRKADGITLVHCVAGVSRSASIVIAYLMRHMGMSLKNAYHHVKNARPQIRPNIGFFRQLMAYEEEIRGSKSVEMIFQESLGQEIPDLYEPEYRAFEEYYQRQRNNGKKR